MRFGKQNPLVHFLILSLIIIALITMVLFLGGYHAILSASLLLSLLGLALAVVQWPTLASPRTPPATVRSRSPPRS